MASLPLSYTINSTRQCLRGNSFVLTNTCFESLPGIMFVWKTGSGINTPAPPGTPITFSYPAAGTFNGVLQLRNAGNCDVELPVTVVVLPKPTAAIEPSGSNCVGLNAPQVRDATVADPADPVTGWWWEVNGVVATTQVPPAMVPPHGSIRARLAVVSQEGCQSDTVTRNIVIGDQPRAAFSVITACSNDFAELRDQSSLPAGSTGQEVVSWQWSVDGVPVSAGQHPRLLLPGGPHQVQLIAVSNIGCRSAPHDSLIEVRDAPRIGLQWLDSCAGRPFLVQATDSAGGVQQWHWSRSGGRFTPGGAQVTERYPRAGRYAVAVAGSNSFGCTDTLQAVITVYDVPAPLFTDTLAAIAEPVMLDGGGMPGAAYLWSPANGLDSPATARPVALWDENQHYTLLVRSPEGCTRQSEVLVRRMLGPDIYVPDAFTPNGDGKNDLLRPVTVGIRELRYFSVFDRSGQRIFHSIDARLGWDGRIGGAQAGTSTFVYVAEGISYQGKRIFKKGTVTLIR
ncbi:MAG: T9SS type B sorting domain-containing protein [Chitinophagaceae bacterium]|nr:MAG: T9SS type B sorting domain-containing protein [Chitinophagaceae bacterium]